MANEVAENIGNEPSPTEEVVQEENVLNEPEVKAEPETEEKEDTRTVPLKALQEERYLRQEANRKLQTAMKDLESLIKWREENEKSIKEHSQKLKDDEEREKFNNEPFQVLFDKIKTLEQLVQNRETKVTKEDPVEELGSFVRKHQETVQRDIPDYQNAYAHWANNTFQKYIDLGFDDSEAQTLFSRDEFDIIKASHKSGISPFQAIYKASMDLGYGGKSQVKEEDTKDSNIVASVKKATSAPKSLARTGGKAPASEKVNIDDMDDKEFEKYFKKVTKGAISY